MTNSQKILKTWTNLKPKLQPLIYLYQNKTLIKESIEFYLLQTSSFLLGINHNRISFNLPINWKITPLTEPTISQFDQTGKLSQEWK